MISRIKAIDVLRGFAVAIMVLCNNPGNGDRNYIHVVGSLITVSLIIILGIT